MACHSVYPQLAVLASSRVSDEIPARARPKNLNPQPKTLSPKPKTEAPNLKRKPLQNPALKP